MPLDGVLARPLLLGEPVERLERRLGGRDPGGVLLGLLLRAVVDHPQPADQRRQRQSLDDDREQDDAVGEEDHEVALGERRAGVGLQRQRERRRERDRAAHPGPADDHSRGGADPALDLARAAVERAEQVRRREQPQEAGADDGRDRRQRVAGEGERVDPRDRVEDARQLEPDQHEQHAR